LSFLLLTVVVEIFRHKWSDGVPHSTSEKIMGLRVYVRSNMHNPKNRH